MSTLEQNNFIFVNESTSKKSYLTRVGETFTAFTFDPSVGMPTLYRLLENRGVKFVKKRVTGLEELSGYDYVFNCSGIGAARLFGDDTLDPVSGHVLRVKAPWLNTAMFLKESAQKSAYAIPR